MMRYLLLGFVALCAACGGKSDDTLGDGGTEGGDECACIDAGPNKECPAVAPASNSACARDGLQCEYGSDRRWTCNDIAVCGSGQWERLKNGDVACPTPTQNPKGCPSTRGAVSQGAQCSDLGLSCDYSTSTSTDWCSCSYMGGPPLLDGGSYSTWYCTNPPETGCPLARPTIGSHCSQPDLNCNYDVCGVPSGLAVQCNTSTLTWTEGYGDLCAGAN